MDISSLNFYNRSKSFWNRTSKFFTSLGMQKRGHFVSLLLSFIFLLSWCVFNHMHKEIDIMIRSGTCGSCHSRQQPPALTVSGSETLWEICSQWFILYHISIEADFREMCSVMTYFIGLVKKVIDTYTVILTQIDLKVKPARLLQSVIRSI